MTDLHLPTPTARGVDALAGGLDDSVYNRLLKERIIVLGTEVTDQVANRICAQLLLLAAEDPERDITCGSTRPAARCIRAWPSTTRCSSSPTTSPRSRWAWRPRWGSCCSAPVPRAS